MRMEWIRILPPPPPFIHSLSRDVNHGSTLIGASMFKYGLYLHRWNASDKRSFSESRATTTSAMEEDAFAVVTIGKGVLYAN